MSDPLETALSYLAINRRNLEQYKAKIKELEAELYATHDYQNYARLVEEETKLIDEQTARAKAAALAKWRVNGVKKLPGVTIKDVTTWSLTDPKAAFEYAAKENQNFLTLDIKGVLQLAKKLEGTKHALPFASKTMTVEAQISSDLSNFISQPEKVENEHAAIPF